MTDLGVRIRRLGNPVASIGRDAHVTRGHLSNAMYGRRRLSPAAEARVEDVLRRLEGERAESIWKLQVAEQTLAALGGELLSPIRSREERHV